MHMNLKNFWYSFLVTCLGSLFIGDLICDILVLVSNNIKQ
jgi:hypothetical protein